MLTVASFQPRVSRVVRPIFSGSIGLEVKQALDLKAELEDFQLLRNQSGAQATRGVFQVASGGGWYESSTKGKKKEKKKKERKGKGKGRRRKKS